MTAFVSLLLHHFVRHYPPDAGSVKIFLPLIRGGNAAPPAGAGAFELIQAAQAAGKINAETALLYKVYATFDRSRLPAPYRSAPNPSAAYEGHAIMRDALAAWPSLSGEAQLALAPFFQPPIYQGSWYDRQRFPQSLSAAGGGEAAPDDTPAPPPLQRPGWQHIVTANGKGKVWWDGVNDAGQAGKAQIIAALLNETWGKETGLMARSPLSDAGTRTVTTANGVQVKWGDGGDDRFDVYIAPCDGCGGAATFAYPPDCKKTPAYMLIDPTFGERWLGLSTDTKALQAAVSHEFMHAIQYVYNYAQACPEYRNFEEASAEWAVDFVYPDNQHEHGWPFRFQQPDRSLFGGYSDWAFLYFMTKQLGSTGVYVDAWNNTERQDNIGAEDAMEKALKSRHPDGFKQYWPEFARNLWNRPPFDFFQQRNQFAQPAFGHPLRKYGANEKPYDHTEMVALNGQRSQQWELPLGLPPLSIRYFHFKFTNDDVRSVGFMNYYEPVFPNPYVKVQALIKIAGRPWEKEEDWSADREHGFCRDAADERVEELVFVFSHGYPPGQSVAFEPPVLPRFTVSNVGCHQWRGTVSVTHLYNDDPITETQQATLSFERRILGKYQSPTNSYDLKAGQVHVERWGTKSDCTLQRNILDQALGPDNGDLTVNGLNYWGAVNPTVAGTAFPSGYRELVYHCEEGSYTNQETSRPTMQFDLFNPPRVSTDGRRISGTQTIALPESGWSSTYTFNLEAVAEP